MRHCLRTFTALMSPSPQRRTTVLSFTRSNWAASGGVTNTGAASLCVAVSALSMFPRFCSAGCRVARAANMLAESVAPCAPFGVAARNRVPFSRVILRAFRPWAWNKCAVLPFARVLWDACGRMWWNRVLLVWQPYFSCITFPWIFILYLPVVLPGKQ